MAPPIASASSKLTAEQQDNELHYTEDAIKRLDSLEEDASQRFACNTVLYAIRTIVY
jgi:hypothetical protein